MIRILHLITDLDVGGSETALVRLVSRLDRRRFSSSVMSLTSPGPLAARLADMGVQVTALARRPAIGPLLVWRLLHAARRAQPTIVQTWLYHADLLGTLAARTLRAPALCWNIRCAELDRRDHSRSLFWIIGTLAKLSSVPDAVVVNSAAGRRSHEAAGYKPRKWVLIPNGFEVPAESNTKLARGQLRRTLGLPAETPLVGIVARWHPMKDHTTFVEASAKVANVYPGAHFIMAGRGVDAANTTLVRLVKEQGIWQQSHLLGEIEDGPGVLAALDVAVSSSYGEAFPNVIGEAMSNGVPVVTTDAGDSGEIVGDTGIVVPCRDPSALGAAVVRLLALTPEERRARGARGRERVLQHYSLDAAVRRYEQLYSDLAGRAVERA